MYPERNNETITAAQWMARRDRGLSAAEQDAYLQWLLADRTRSVAIAELERTWTRLDAMHHWRPAHSPFPNPDLLAKGKRHRTPWLIAALAASLILAILGWQSFRAGPDRIAQIVPRPERLTLEDGSLVDLNTGAQIEVSFRRDERRVRLVRGEAHFTVARNPDRPFIVDVDGYAVRAVGTAFLVQRGATEVSVLVTEGRVRMDVATSEGDVAVRAGRVLAHLHVGQLATAVHPEPGAATRAPSVRDLTPQELDAFMPWRGIRLEFEDLPLRDVVREFNRFNVRQLIIVDADTGRIPVGGSFRADNLDAFVRLLDSGFDVSAESRGNEIMLRRR